MRLPPEWSEFIGLLISHRVRFLVVGAHALAALGRPRATQDIDLFVEPTLKNAERLGAALKAFGFVSLARQWRQFATGERFVVLGREPLRIDILNTLTGITFAEAWKGRRRLDFGGAKVGFLGKRAYVKNKRAAGRPKDLLDLELLRERPRRR